MRINTSHSETGKFKEVKICMLRNAQINWEWSLIKMTTYLLHDWVQLYFATLVVHVTPMKVTNQPVNLWSLSCGNNLLSLHSCLHHWSHSWTCIWRSVPPCSRQITTLILISKDFAWITVVEQQWGEIPSCLQNNSLLGGKPHSRGVSKGWRPKIFPGF